MSCAATGMNHYFRCDSHWHITLRRPTVTDVRVYSSVSEEKRRPLPTGPVYCGNNGVLNPSKRSQAGMSKGDFCPDLTAPRGTGVDTRLCLSVSVWHCGFFVLSYCRYAFRESHGSWLQSSDHCLPKYLEFLASTGNLLSHRQQTESGRERCERLQFTSTFLLL